MKIEKIDNIVYYDGHSINYWSEKLGVNANTLHYRFNSYPDNSPEELVDLKNLKNKKSHAKKPTKPNSPDGMYLMALKGLGGFLK